MSNINQLLEAIKLNMVGSCNCGTKTPEVSYHNEWCLYSTLNRSYDIIKKYIRHE